MGKKKMEPELARIQALLLALVALCVAYDVWLFADGKASEANPPFVVLPIVLLFYWGCIRYTFGREHHPVPWPLPKRVLDDAWDRSGLNPKNVSRKGADDL